MGINFSKVSTATKFLFNRACGVKYGSVHFPDGSVKLVKSSKLKKLSGNIVNRLNCSRPYRTPNSVYKDLDENGINTVVRMTKPIKGDTFALRSSLENSLAMSGERGSLIVTNRFGVNPPLMQLHVENTHPIKTWLKANWFKA